jgi:hypothetical protein
MPLQTGTWTANLGGSVVQIQINSVDPSGTVLGNVGAAEAGGLWDEDAQKLTLMLTQAQLPPSLLTGYLFTDSVNTVGVSGSVIFTLAGYCENFSAAVALAIRPTAKRSVFGWYAQIGVD